MRRQPAIRFLNENTDEAVIEIYGQIGYEGWDREDDENTARLMSGELDRIKALNAKRITVKINSLGGDVNHALAIHDLLAEHPALVTTQINGLCASAATIVAMAGKERRMSKNALFLIHQCSAYVGRANQEQLAQELETQKTVNGRMLDIYTAACNGKEAEISELLKANNGLGKWLTATEAKDFGFVTDIYNESRKTACFTQSAFSDNGLPALPEAYADMVAAEDTRSPWQSLVDLLTKHFSGNDNPQNQTLTDMKKLFPLLAVALALQDTAAYDPEKGRASPTRSSRPSKASSPNLTPSSKNGRRWSRRSKPLWTRKRLSPHSWPLSPQTATASKASWTQCPRRPPPFRAATRRRHPRTTCRPT